MFLAQNIISYLLYFLCSISSVSASRWVLKTNLVPSVDIEQRHMAYLGNGELSVIPYLLSDLTNNSINVNCLYNGHLSDSHRARVPNYSNYIPLVKGITEPPTYSLDMLNGIFNVKYQTKTLGIDHKVFVH